MRINKGMAPSCGSSLPEKPRDGADFILMRADVALGRSALFYCTSHDRGFPSPDRRDSAFVPWEVMAKVATSPHRATLTSPGNQAAERRETVSIHKKDGDARMKRIVVGTLSVLLVTALFGSTGCGSGGIAPGLPDNTTTPDAPLSSIPADMAKGDTPPPSVSGKKLRIGPESGAPAEKVKDTEKDATKN